MYRTGAVYIYTSHKVWKVAMHIHIKEAIEKACALEKIGLESDAFKVYESNLANFPDSYPLLMGAGRTATKMSDTKSGLKYFRRAIHINPDRPEPIINIGNLQEKDDLVEAAKTYSNGLSRFPDSYLLLMGAGRAATKMSDTKSGLEYFRRAIHINPDRPEPIINIGNLQEKDDLVEAAKTYSKGFSRFPDSAQLRDLEIQAKVLLNSDEEPSSNFDIDAEIEKMEYGEKVYLAALRNRSGSLSEEDISKYYGCLADSFQYDSSIIRYADSLIGIKKYKEALQAFESVSNDANKNVLMGKAICKGAQGKFEESRGFLERYLDRDVSDHNVLTTCITFMSVSPDLSMTTDVIGELNKNYRDTGLENLLEFSRNILPPKRELLKGNIRDNSFRLSAQGDSQAVVLAFAGFALKTGALPFSLLDRFFAGHGVAVGSLVDAHGFQFWKGVPSLGESFEATIAALNNRLGAMSIDKKYTVGNSGGGAAAIVYGCALDARRAISFSGPTDLRRSFLDQHGDKRGQAVIHALNKRLDESQLNVRGWLEKRDSRCPIHAYYCEKEKYDAIQAENISHLSEVSLRPVGRYSIHECIGSALGVGDLLKEFKSVLEDIDFG